MRICTLTPNIEVEKIEIVGDVEWRPNNAVRGLEELPRFRGRYGAWVSSSLLIIIFIV